MSGGEAEVAAAIRSLGKALGHHNSRLRSAQQATRKVISRLRYGPPLSEADRNLLADFLEGGLDRTSKSFELGKFKEALRADIRQMKIDVKGQSPRVLMEEIYKRVAAANNKSPVRPRKVTVDELRNWYEK